MKHNFEDENEVYDENYIRRRRAEMVPDGGSVRVPVQLMDSAQRDRASRYSLADSRSEGVRLRDEAHALMVDRMKNPKSYDHNGRRIVNDGVEAQGRESPMAGPSRDNRRPHSPKPIRDRAEAIRLRDETYALMVAESEELRP
jgi:hypothetical protein